MSPIIITSKNVVTTNKHWRMPLFGVMANKMRQEIMDLEDAEIFRILDGIAKSGNI